MNSMSAYYSKLPQSNSMGNSITENTKRKEILGEYDRIGQMTDEEKNVFLLWYDKDKEKAMEFYEKLAPVLDKRVYVVETKEAAKFAKEHSILANAGTVAKNIIYAPDTAGTFVQEMFNEEFNPYAPGFKASYTSEAIRGATAENINNPVWRFVYSTGMSMADSAAVMPMGGIGIAFLGANAAVAEGRKTAIEGGSKAQIFAKGIAAGAFEAFFEKVGLDNLFKPRAVGGLAKALQVTLAQGGIEASEELCTSIANNLIDDIIMGDESNYKKLVKEYLAKGMSLGEAQYQAMIDMGGEVLTETLAGFVSGVAFGAGGAAINYTNAVNTGKQVNAQGNKDALIDYAKGQDRNSTAYKDAVKLSDKKSVKNAEVGALLQQMIIDKQISEADANKLVSVGLDGAPLDEAEQAYYYAGANGVSIKDTVELNSDLDVDSDRAIKAWQMGAKLYEGRKADVQNAEAVEKNTERPKEIEKTKEAPAGQNDGNVAETPAGQNDGRAKSIVKENYNEAAEEFRTEENAELFDVAYNQGLLGEKLNLGVIVPDKDISAVSQAYVAGTRDARIISERRANFDNRTPGLFTDTVTEQLSKKIGSRTLNAIDALGKKLGVQIHFIQRGEAGHEKDSYYSPSKGVIAINVNEIHGKLTGDKLLRFIANHEGIHRIKETSPKAYAEMEKIALSKSKQTVEDRMARFKESKERATEEIVADYFGEVLTSKAEIKTLLNEHRSVFDAIMEALEWLVDKMRGIANYSFSEIAEARKLFQEALAEADANVWGTEVRSDGETLYGRSEGKTFTITEADVKASRAIPRKSVNELTSEEIKSLENLAKKVYSEIKEKSPFFRAWFGDWRAGDKNPVKVVDIPKWDGKIETGSVKVEDTGWDVFVGGHGKRNTISHSGEAELSAKGLANIQGLMENAVLLDTEIHEHHSNSRPNEQIYFDHKFYALGKTERGIELYKITVEEMYQSSKNDDYKRFHNLRQIDLVAEIKKEINASDVLKDGNEPSSEYASKHLTSTYTVADLFNFVKTYDKSFKPKPSSLVVNEDGTPMVVYHQTKNNFTVFDTRHEGAGTRDEETPFGVFLKPTKENIGIKGEIQMPLYARITNLLEASDRGELVSKLKGLSDKYAELYDAHKKLDAKFKKEFDKAAEDFKNYLIQWRKENPEASRRAIYEDENFEKMYGAEEKVLEEWGKEARALELEMKEEITAALKHAEYDGVHIKNDAGSFGKKTETYIALENTQVKSATDNIGTFDSRDSDILWSKSEDSEDNVKYFPPGEDPRRDIKVPSEVNGKKVMRFIRTAAESPALTPEMAEDVVSEIENGRFYYTPSSNKALADNAMNKVENDVIQAASEWKTAFDSGKRITDNDIALGEALIIETGKRGDTERAIELICEVGIAAKEAGKVVQAIKLLKRMTPEGQVYYLSKVVERLNKERGKTKGKEFNKSIEAENKATEADRKYKQAEAKVKTAEEKLFDIETAIEEYTKDLDIEVKIAELVEKIADLKKKLSEVKGKVKSADASTENLGGKIKEIEGQLEEERKKLKEAMAKRDAILKERAEKGITLSKLKAGVKHVDNATDHILGEIDILEDDISKIEEEYDKAVKFRDECAEERRRLIEEKNFLIKDTKAADKASERYSKEISQLEEQISELSDKYIAAKSAAIQASLIRKQLKAERNELSSKLAKIENAIDWENENRETEIAKLKEEIAQLLNAEFEASKELEKAKEERTLMQKAKDKARKLSSAAKMGANIIELPADIKKAILESKTEEELNESVELAKDYIAENMVTTKAERIRAWRYLSMLGNLRTQDRNIIGNGLMLLNVLSKNVVATPIETIVVYASHKSLEKKLAKMKADGATEEELKAYRDEHYAERTKTWTLFKKKSAELKSFVTESWESNIKLAKGQSGKNDNIIGDINDRRTIFKSEKPVLKQVAAGVEAWRKATNRAMERGDEVFLRINYKHALTSYILSNKWDVNTMTEAQKMRAEQYALKEAQEATFRDDSALADLINKARNKGWGYELAIGGLMPFTKTPINITKRSIEYGPTGIINAIAQGVKAAKGEATSSDVVNALAKTFSGSALAGLGFYLAAKGLLRSKGDEEDEEYNYLIGEQDYSLIIGDYRFSIEWAAPAAVPLLFGASIYNAWFEKDGGTKEEYMVDENGNIVLNTNSMATHKVMNAVSTMFAPIFEASYLSGLTDSVGAAFSFGSGDASEGLAIFGINAGLSYANQFIPTVFGQIARTIDPVERRNNDYDKTSILPYSVQRGIEKSKNKIPFLNQTSTPYVNAWGVEEIKKGALDYILSGAENFVLPGYIEKITDDELTDELWRLQKTEAAEEKKVFPESVGTSYKDGETIPLTAEQRNKRQKVAGQKGREYIEAFYNSDEYGKLTDAERVEAIDLLWAKANEEGIQAVCPDYASSDTNVERLNYAEKNIGISPEDYALWRIAYERANEDGNSSYNMDEVDAALDIFIELSGEEWTDEQLGYLWQQRSTALSNKNPYGYALRGTPWYKAKQADGQTWKNER
ncbi:MAG: hypothetical protein U0M60_02835 [Clostridia bacterium]|nr:hypothetical protein [Clostridia bacterium]